MQLVGSWLRLSASNLAMSSGWPWRQLRELHQAGCGLVLGVETPYNGSNIFCAFLWCGSNWLHVTLQVVWAINIPLGEGFFVKNSENWQTRHCFFWWNYVVSGQCSWPNSEATSLVHGPKQTKSVGKSWCDSVVCFKNPWSSSWWFQPIWKILVKSGSSSPSRDENKRCLKPPPSPVFF